MGIVICKTHGRAGLIEVCSHVAAQIDDGRAPSGHRLTIMHWQFLCDDCFHAYRIESFASLAELPLEERFCVTDGRAEAFEAALEAMEGLRIFCGSCFAEAEGRNQPSSF